MFRQLISGLVVLTGCGSDGDGQKLNDAAMPLVDAAQTGASDAAPMNGPGCSCAAAEACVRINVSLASDSTSLPWKVWPDEATGSGRLFAGVSTAGAPSKVSFENDVNLKTGFTKKTLDVCVSPGSGQAFCFLDDRGDGMLKEPSGLLTGSSNYLDTCMNQRQVSVTASGGSTTNVDCVLAVSCD